MRPERISSQTPDPAVLFAAGEPFAAGFCEMPASTPIERYARAWRRWLEQAPLPQYNGRTLYPNGPKHPGDIAVRPDHSRTWTWDRLRLNAKIAGALPGPRSQLAALAAWLEHEQASVPNHNPRHSVGGNGFTHAIVKYEQVLNEGLDSYKQRIQQGLKLAATKHQRTFYCAMLDLLEGIRGWHGRLLENLLEGSEISSRSRRLLDALGRVPFRPARNFYEAMVAYNFIFYLDGCDNPGRMDQVLIPFYKGPAESSEVITLISDFADNVSHNKGWSVALGGTGPAGEPAYNALTELVLRATRGRFRPSLELRVRRDMPASVWKAAFEALASGNGQPAFYHEEAYLDGLRAAELGIAEEDLSRWNGGGCTETMLHGCSNVGSLDAGFNLPLILAESLAQNLQDNISFDQVMAAYEADLKREVEQTLGRLNQFFKARARYRPQPMRSLLIDDCIDRARDFNDGGARYNWSVVNVAGLANVADALAALLIVVFERRELSPSGLAEVLRSDFEGDEWLRQRLLSCPKFGNDQPVVDDLARRIAEFVYDLITRYPCARGGKFLPSHIMFETFSAAGASVGALPDGRRAGEPLADSVGPVQGRDRRGPTAMLRSVTRLPLHKAIGTPVLNLRLAKSAVVDQAARSRLRALVESFFAMGGLQLQLSLLDRAELEDALVYPEKHEDLIVRIGGYSTHFNWLSPALKQEVMKRTEY